MSKSTIATIYNDLGKQTVEAVVTDNANECDTWYNNTEVHMEKVLDKKFQRLMNKGTVITMIFYRIQHTILGLSYSRMVWMIGIVFEKNGDKQLTPEII